MAEPYLSILTQHIKEIHFPNVSLECKHFFSGAAVYANGKIVASLSPTGFAIKLSKDERQKLIQNGEGTEFRFFPGGPIKKEYVLLKDSIIQDKELYQNLFTKSIQYVTGKQT